MRIAGDTPFGLVKNLVLLLAGSVLAFQVVASLPQTSRAVQLGRSLDDAAALASNGDDSAAAAAARAVLAEKPSSGRALLGYVCSAWNAGDRDAAAAMLQGYHRARPSMEAFEACIRGEPLGNYLAWLPFDGTVRSGGLLYSRSSALESDVSPSDAEFQALPTQLRLLWIAIACRNGNAGLHQLGKRQVALFESAGGDVSQALGELPEAWGCNSVLEPTDE